MDDYPIENAIFHIHAIQLLTNNGKKEKSVQDRKISNFGLYTFRVLYMGHNLLASHTFLLHTLLILIPTNSDKIIEQIMII